MANDRTLVQIRERSYLDLLDLALLVVRQRPRALGLAAAAGIAPFAALNYGILSNPETPPAIWPVLLFLEAPWATVPLTLVLGGLMFAVLLSHPLAGGAYLIGAARARRPARAQNLQQETQ